MGRPKLNSDEVRNIDVTVALNAKEFQIISARSKRAKKTVAAFLRLMGMDDKSLKIVPAINEEAAKYLRELQHLLIQITALLQQNQINAIDPITFIEMQKEIKQMHFDLLNYGNHQNHDR